MTVVNPQARDIIFRFDNSCNSDCFRFWSCCTGCAPVDDDDLAYVTSDGVVKRFDMRHGHQGALRAIQNIRQTLEARVPSPQIVESIKIAVQTDLQITLDDESQPPIISVSQVKRIESIAIRHLTRFVPEKPAPIPSRLIRTVSGLLPELPEEPSSTPELED